MKLKFLLLMGLAFAVLLTPTSSAMASEDDAAYLLGGILGGLVIGEVINNHKRHDYYDNYDPYYSKHTPRYRQRCWTKERVVWNPYIEDYDTVPYTVCR